MISPNKVIVFDVDDTILTTANRDYQSSRPIPNVVDGIRKLKKNGWTIVLHTARGMGRSNGYIDSIAKEVRAEIDGFCEKHNVPYDQLILGKTWASAYVDDKAMTPSMFLQKLDRLLT